MCVYVQVRSGANPLGCPHFVLTIRRHILTHITIPLCSVVFDRSCNTCRGVEYKHSGTKTQLCCGRRGVWEAGLSVAGDLAGYIGLVRAMRLMCIVLSTLLTLLLLLLYSFVDVSSPLRICFNVLRTRDLLLLGGMLFWFCMSAWSVWSYLFP